MALELLTTTAFERDLKRVRKQGKDGIIDRAGTFSPWEFASRTWDTEFSEGLMRFEDKATEHWGFANMQGRVVVPARFDSVQLFSEGRAVVFTDSAGFGYIDADGRPVTPSELECAESFHEGLAAAKVKNKGWGYIDKAGKFVIEPRFDKAGDFDNGLAVVRLGGLAGVIDRAGKFVIEPRFTEIGAFRDGLAPVFLRVGNNEDSWPRERWGFVDKTGKVLEIHP